MWDQRPKLRFAPSIRIDSNSMHCISCALKRKVEKPLLFKQTLKSRFTCLACQHFSFDAKKSLDRERPFSLALRVVSLFLCLSRLAPSVTRVVICVSRAFCSTDQEKRETARSLQWFDIISFYKPRLVYLAIWYNLKPFANRKGRFKLSIPAKCTLSKGKSLNKKVLKFNSFYA